MAVLCAREIHDGERIGVGVESPIPLVGALLARTLSAPGVIIGSRGVPGGARLVGSHEFTQLAQSGKIDLFFLAAAQVDAQANINLQYIIENGRRKRFFGAFAAPIYYAVARRTVLYRVEHSPRVLVNAVDCITATGWAAARERRLGGPTKIITGRAVLRVDHERRTIELESFHPGETLATVQAATGFELVIPDDVRETPPPTEAEKRALREHVYPALSPAAVPWLIAS